MTLTARATLQNSGPAAESITMTPEQLQDLVLSVVMKCFATLNLAVSPEAITEALAAQHEAVLAQVPSGAEPKQPAPLDPDDPSLVTTYVLKPVHEGGLDYRPGAHLYTTPERAARLADLGLVTLNSSEASPSPPTVPSTPVDSGLSMAGAPSMIGRK